jgi:hypothetical protein
MPKAVFGEPEIYITTDDETGEPVLTNAHHTVVGKFGYEMVDILSKHGMMIIWLQEYDRNARFHVKHGWLQGDEEEMEAWDESAKINYSKAIAAFGPSVKIIRH